MFSKKIFFYLFLFFVLILSSGFAYSADSGVSGLINLQEVNLANIQPKTLLFNPSSGTAGIGNEFSVEVIAYPSYEGVSLPLQRVNNLEFSVYYDPNFMDYLLTENLVNGFSMEAFPSSGLVKIQMSGMNPYENFFSFQPKKIVNIKFKPIKESASTPITLNQAFIMNSYANEGRSAALIQTYQPANIAIKTGGSCVPSCAGKICGTNGCGGFCGANNGNCPNAGDNCLNGQCGCQPSCFSKQCGDNGCSGNCGVCSAGKTCTNGLCSIGIGTSSAGETSPGTGTSGPLGAGGGIRRLPATEPSGIIPAQTGQPAVQQQAQQEISQPQQPIVQPEVPSQQPQQPQQLGDQTSIPKSPVLENPELRLADYWWLIILILVICGVIIFIIWYRRKKEQGPQQFNYPFQGQQSQQNYQQQYPQQQFQQGQQRPPYQ